MNLQLKTTPGGPCSNAAVIGLFSNAFDVKAITSNRSAVPIPCFEAGPPLKAML